MAAVRRGAFIARRYVVMAPLARGGVGEVYHAVDVLHSRQSALKVVGLPGVAARDMVRREAAFTDQLRHPSVPRVYGVGDTALPDGTVVGYLVLELLRGVPLAHRLAGGPLPVRDALRIAATVADVLAVAHRRGMVHGDLNPTNIMLTPTGPKIIDFGLAHLGTAGAEDVYALGVLLCLMLTGRLPPGGFRPPRPAPTPVLLVPDRAARRSDHQPAFVSLSRAVADLCRGCMAKRPNDRPDSTTVALALWSALYARTPAQESIGSASSGARHN